MNSKKLVSEIILLPFVLLSLIASEQIPVLTPLDTASVVCPVLPLDDLGTNISAPGFVMTHMAIDGAGWFVVSDPSGTRFVTRRGDFRLDSNNNLITARGYRVQGFTDLDLTTVGDVQIDSAVHPNFVDPAAAMTTFSVQANGVVHVAMSDGTKFTRAQILLQQISRPENIQRIYPDVFLAEKRNDYLDEDIPDEEDANATPASPIPSQPSRSPSSSPSPLANKSHAPPQHYMPAWDMSKTMCLAGGAGLEQVIAAAVDAMPPEGLPLASVRAGGEGRRAELKRRAEDHLQKILLC